jgi:anti-anti-sigma regulatory factor
MIAPRNNYLDGLETQTDQWPPSHIDLDCLEIEQLSVVRVSGEMSSQTLPMLHDCLTACLQVRPQLVVNLSAGRMEDPSILNALLAARNRAVREGGWIRLVVDPLSTDVRRLLAAAPEGTSLPVFDSEEDAFLGEVEV